MRYGVMGGTFDPIHIGHLIIAQEAGWQLGLDKVLFVPAGDPPHKHKSVAASANERLEMVRLATAGNPLFEVSAIEVERGGLSYTADTLASLRQSLPHDELFFIIGVDALSEILSWHEPARIIELARLAVAERPGYRLPLDQLTQALPGLTERLTFLQAPLIEVAAHEIRPRIKAGQPVRYLLPDAVHAYIQEHRLYRA